MNKNIHFRNHNNACLISLIWVLLFSLILLTNPVFGQDIDNVSITIIDTMVIKKKRHDVLKLRIRIILKNVHDSTYVEDFFRIVPANIFVFDTAPKDSELNCRYSALFYSIENSNGEIIPASLTLTHSKHEDSRYNQKTYRYLDTLKLRYRKSSRRIIIFPNNDLVVKGDTTLLVYPNIDEFHYLKKGTYYLYLYYCNKFERDNTIRFPAIHEVPTKGKFHGYFLSNKVKVIVK